MNTYIEVIAFYQKVISIFQKSSYLSYLLFITFKQYATPLLKFDLHINQLTIKMAFWRILENDLSVDIPSVIEKAFK